MLRILGQRSTTCDGVSRRDILQAGALSLFSGLTLPQLLAAREASPLRGKPRANSVILFNLFGGPSHIDMFDLKPDAPVEVRGEFKPIASSVPGLQVCEHLPRLAQRMDRATLIRTVSHGYNSHNPYALMTGFTLGADRENYFAKPTDHPSMGSICQYAGLGRKDVPTYVCMPAHPGYSQALRRAGPYGGYLGGSYDPLMTFCEPKLAREPKDFYDPVPPQGEPSLPLFDPQPGVTIDRLAQRQSLLDTVEQQFDAAQKSPTIDLMSEHQRRAFTLLTTDRTRRAFDLGQESAATRATYGDSLYGSCALLARRLVEAGVTFVTVTTESKGAGHWDSHQNNFGMLRDFNLPNLDQILSALLDDLEARGLLDTTLVVAMGDMGRAPRVNRFAGRDHWPQCGFCLLAGGGTKRGYVHGSTDRTASYPTTKPVSPGDIVATIYQILGIDPHLIVHDLSDRPIHVTHGGQPINEVLA
ncbi:MAG: DUF1501 domain-containing protein [Planctomycetes bacterium]|nr:DUF1501 domain-containing protein [Planctomycetota bacterium]